MSKKEDRHAAFEKHYKVCEALGKHLGMPEPNGMKISTALLKIEKEAHRCAEGYCNGESRTVYGLGGGRREFHFDNDENAWDAFEEIVTTRVRNVFDGRLPVGFAINGDPRGYSLKLEPNSVPREVGLHTDFGGYQVLSPEIES